MARGSQDGTLHPVRPKIGRARRLAARRLSKAPALPLEDLWAVEAAIFIYNNLAHPPPAAEGQPLSERSTESMASDRELDGRAAPTHNTGDEPREDVADAEEVRDQLYPRKAHTEQGPDPCLGC